MDSPSALGILTSGGDAPGMNAVVRAVVASSVHHGVPVFGINEGFQGLVDGLIRPLALEQVGGILQRAGTLLGTARCAAFRERPGRIQAATNLFQYNINKLIVVGGDGSLTGAEVLRREWSELLAAGGVKNPTPLTIVGLVGSIDNDFVGIDMTIGADSALHRIIDAIDALSGTAASHQRTFVVEVMGRHCGYLALMSALATAADGVFIPEQPPAAGWEAQLCDTLRTGRAAGRRDSIVIVAEGATDQQGQPITSEYVRQVLETRLQQDVRVTILGHVQRGGVPSAFDRLMATQLGDGAVRRALRDDGAAVVLGLHDYHLVERDLVTCVAATQQVATQLANGEYAAALAQRGPQMVGAWDTFNTLSRIQPRPVTQTGRLAILHLGDPAPGMNTAVRAATRLALDKGWRVWGVHNGLRGLLQGGGRELSWMSVGGWATLGGAELGTDNGLPQPLDEAAGHALAAQLATQFAAHDCAALLLIGGLPSYRFAEWLTRYQAAYPALRLPVLCLPAAIDNNLPHTDMSLGADTALNSIVEALDKIKQSAVATRRAFVVEVMGQDCGYLALLSGLASGAEGVYVPEKGITLNDLAADIARLRQRFAEGKRLGLLIRSEGASPQYTTGFLATLLQQESQGEFEARAVILGPLQQGGDPSPLDRILATRLANEAVIHLLSQHQQANFSSHFMGLHTGRIRFVSLKNQRKSPKSSSLPSWQDLFPLTRRLAYPHLCVSQHDGLPR